jgi:hypothetical protein
MLPAGRRFSNRRAQQVELTDEGKALFYRLRRVAARQDQRLRSQLGDAETELLGDLLDRLTAGVEGHGRRRTKPARLRVTAIARASAGQLEQRVRRRAGVC